jgi:hypothetical protein
LRGRRTARRKMRAVLAIYEFCTVEAIFHVPRKIKTAGQQMSCGKWLRKANFKTQ